jgi:hypothetical protein
MGIGPDAWVPLVGIGLLLLLVTTVGSIAGAWGIGRARGQQDAASLRERVTELEVTIQSMQRSLESSAAEIERLGEVQRLALKALAEKVASPVDAPRLHPPGRVITPH